MGMKTYKGLPITITASSELIIGSKTFISGSKNIIEDIISWCDNKELIVIYLACVREGFQKDRVLFRLEKYELLKS